MEDIIHFKRFVIKDNEFELPYNYIRAYNLDSLNEPNQRDSKYLTNLVESIDRDKYFMAFTPQASNKENLYNISMGEIEKIDKTGVFGANTQLYLFEQLVANMPYGTKTDKEQCIIRDLIIGRQGSYHIGGIILDGDYDFETHTIIIPKDNRDIKLVLTYLPFHQYSSDDKRLCLDTHKEKVNSLTYSSMVSDPADTHLFHEKSFGTKFSISENRKEYIEMYKLDTFTLTIANANYNYFKVIERKVREMGKTLNTVKVNNVAYNKYIEENYIGMCKNAVESPLVKNIVLVAGVGGTGSFFNNIYNDIVRNRYLLPLEFIEGYNNNYFNSIVVTADYDIIESRNLSRYKLESSYNGFYKTILSTDHEIFRPYVHKVETFFENILTPGKVYDKTLYIIGCLDTVASRLELFKNILKYKHAFSKIVYLDAGNKKVDGQVMTVYIKNEKGEEKFNEAFKDYESEIDKDIQIGCSVDNEQTPHINFINASTLVRALMQYQLQFSEEMFYYLTSYQKNDDTYESNVTNIGGKEIELFTKKYMENLITGRISLKDL